MNETIENPLNLQERFDLKQAAFEQMEKDCKVVCEACREGLAEFRRSDEEMEALKYRERWSHMEYGEDCDASKIREAWDNNGVTAST